LPTKFVKIPYQFNGLSLSKVAGDLAAAHDGKGWPPEIVFDFSGLKLLSTWKLVEIKTRLRVVNSTRQINDMIKSRLEREGSGKAVA